MAKINQYPAKTVPSNNDEFVLHDPASGSTKKMTRGDLIGGAALPSNTVNGQAIADGSVTASKTAFGGNYSTSEVNTGFTWIDGKPIYKRTFSGVITIAANSRAVTLVSSGIANIVRHEGEVYETTGGTRMILPSQWINPSNANSGSGYILLDNSGNVNLLTLMPSTRTNAPYTVTLYYTKV